MAHGRMVAVLGNRGWEIGEGGTNASTASTPYHVAWAKSPRRAAKRKIVVMVQLEALFCEAAHIRSKRPL